LGIKYAKLKGKKSSNVDDKKLITRSEEYLGNGTKIVKALSQDINMNFGLEKCAKFV
jgi:hypothetical protein